MTKFAFRLSAALLAGFFAAAPVFAEETAGLMHAGFSDPVSYLLTGAAAILIAAVLVGVGISRLSGDALKPSMTLEQLQRDKVTAREMLQ